MRVKTLLVSERDLLFVIAGQLYSQAPNREPREANTILTKIRDTFRSVAIEDHDHYSLRIAEDKLNIIDKWLKDIPEFNNLNLSQNEVDAGITIEDERPKYLCTSRLSTIPWKSDFIDLDAFTRNVRNELICRIITNNDCFMCSLDGTHETCNDCCNNEKYTNKCGSRRELSSKSKATFACRYDCYNMKIICCKECDKLETCEHTCDSDPNTCGNDINHIGGNHPSLRKKIYPYT